VVIVIYRIKATPAALWLPALLLLAVLIALGVGLWMSASPVAYPSPLVPQRWWWLYGLNPMAGVIDGFRWAWTLSEPIPNKPYAATSCPRFAAESMHAPRADDQQFWH
jgi:lipopolysaccharide transport system permease protein